jgi:hypothetical protein
MITDEQRAKRNEAQAKRGTWRPTPTQEENDLAALGVPGDQIPKRDDGSGPDKHVERNQEVTREIRPKKRPEGGYETR